MKQLKRLPTQNTKKPPSNKSKKEMVTIILLSLLFMLVYFGATAIDIPAVGYTVMILYMVALAVFAIVYISYNYAFTRKNVTADMLPDTWSEEQKKEYIEKGKERFQKSRWMLLVIFPLIVTFMADVLYLFVWNGFLENIFK